MWDSDQETSGVDVHAKPGIGQQQKAGCVVSPDVMVNVLGLLVAIVAAVGGLALWTVSGEP
jgi:hypothetical protein